MKRIPIHFEKIKVKEVVHNRRQSINETIEKTKYLISIEERGQYWTKTIICNREELIILRDKIDRLIEETTTSEVLHISNDKAEIIDKHYQDDELCKNCSYKLTNKCIECLFVLQSPLERKLFIKLNEHKLNFKTQYAIDWKGNWISIEGKEYGNENNNFKNVLTIVDFYIEKGNVNLCIYTDGYSYHERTEEQAIRDRNIDRKLQEFGFQVLRFTGKEVNENCDKIVNDIKKWIY